MTRESPLHPGLLVLGGALFYGAVLAALAYNFGWWGLGESELELAARVEVVPEDDPQASATFTDKALPGETWILGRITYEGKSPPSGQIWALMKGARGEGYAPKPMLADGGTFQLGPVPAKFATGGADVLVRARAEVEPGIVRSWWFDRDPEVREAEVLLRVGPGGRRPIALPGMPLFSVLALFAAGIFLALVPLPENWQYQTAKYITSVLIAFCLTFVVLYHLSVGLIRVQEMATTLPAGQVPVIQLGFATIFKGTYVKDMPETWQFSLTGAPDEPNEVAEGFGAPLWGLLLSVVGAGLFTIMLIVSGIQEQFRTITSKEVRKKLQVIVLHEFYVVFAPVGAIIAYQMMVAGGAANEWVTVAFALLAAGLGLNLILNMAVKKFGDLLGLKDAQK